MFVVVVVVVFEYHLVNGNRDFTGVPWYTTKYREACKQNYATVATFLEFAGVHAPAAVPAPNVEAAFEGI